MNYRTSYILYPMASDVSMILNGLNIMPPGRIVDILHNKGYIKGGVTKKKLRDVQQRAKGTSFCK